MCIRDRANLDVFFVISGLSEVGTFIKTLFYVSVSFHHSFAFETNSTKTMSIVLQNAYSIEKNRIQVVLTVLDRMKILLGLYIVFLLIRYSSTEFPLHGDSHFEVVAMGSQFEHF